METKKQEWFFKSVKETLSKIEEDLERDLARREEEFYWSIDPVNGTIQFCVYRLKKGRKVIWSSLPLMNIVDFDIALEDFHIWWGAGPDQGTQEHAVKPPDNGLL